MRQILIYFDQILILIIGKSMAYYFPLLLALATLISGVICLLDIYCYAPKRLASIATQPTIDMHMPKVIEYSRSFFPVLLIVFIVRSFIFQPYRVPTGSLEPTILPGDFVFVSQFSYGLRLPIINKKILRIGNPKRGDIVVFRDPQNPKRDLIKRVVGVPGDHVVYRDKTLYINGIQAQQHFISATVDHEINQAVFRKSENLLGIKHDIFVWPIGGETQNVDVTVPKDKYFMMGDNRDDSGDSRYFGFAPDENIIGKAQFVILSWDLNQHRIRWHRSGNRLSY